MRDELIKRLRDSQERFIFQGGSQFAVELADLIERLLAENRLPLKAGKKLLAFSGKMLAESRDELSDVISSDIQEWAEQLALLELVTMTGPCGEECGCVTWRDFPTECLQPTALGRAAIEASSRMRWLPTAEVRRASGWELPGVDAAKEAE